MSFEINIEKRVVSIVKGMAFSPDWLIFYNAVGNFSYNNLISQIYVGRFLWQIAEKVS